MFRLCEAKVMLGLVALLVCPDALLVELVRAVLGPRRKFQFRGGRTDSLFNLGGLHVQIEFAERDLQLQRLYLRAIGHELDGVGHW